MLTNLEVLDGRYGDSYARHLVISDLRHLSDTDLQVAHLMFRGVNFLVVCVCVCSATACV